MSECTFCGGSGEMPRPTGRVDCRCDCCQRCQRVRLAERARIVKALRAWADERDEEAAEVIAKFPHAFSAMSPPSRDNERAAADYQRLADAGNELRHRADAIEHGEREKEDRNDPR